MVSFPIGLTTNFLIAFSQITHCSKSFRLEVDLLLGTWASENVSSLTMDELDQFENFVNLETIDIYNVITLRTDVPEDMKRDDGTGVVERIQDWARSSPLGKDPEKYSSVKRAHNLI